MKSINQVFYQQLAQKLTVFCFPQKQGAVVWLTCSWTFTIALFLRNIYKCTVEVSIWSFLLVLWDYFLFPKSMSFSVSLLIILSNGLWAAQEREGGWAGAGFASNQPEQFAQGEDLTLEAEPVGMDCTWQILRSVYGVTISLRREAIMLWNEVWRRPFVGRKITNCQEPVKRGKATSYKDTVVGSKRKKKLLDSNDLRGETYSGT